MYIRFFALSRDLHTCTVKVRVAFPSHLQSGSHATPVSVQVLGELGTSLGHLCRERRANAVNELKELVCTMPQLFECVHRKSQQGEKPVSNSGVVIPSI